MKYHQKIHERKSNAKPINYNFVATSQFSLETRSGLLDQRIVEGYGCIWGSKNQHGEIFTRGCFAKSIQEHGPNTNAAYQIKFRDEHGRVCSLFEVLKENEIGLYFRTVPLDNVQWANDLLVQLKSGSINNFSNGFKFLWDKVKYDEATDSIVVIEARLFEISAVAIPSDMQTFALRSIDEPEYLEEETEEFINTLPKSKQLECRKLITRYISLYKNVPFSSEKAPGQVPPKVDGIDYNYLITHLKN